MDPQKIEAIQHANHPQNTKEILSFLGMGNFYPWYIKDFAIKTKPLRHLLKMISNFHLTTRCDSLLKALTHIHSRANIDTS